MWFECHQKVIHKWELTHTTPGTKTMSTKSLPRKELPGSLPPELWLDIISSLPWRTIQLLSLTSQSFRHATQPLLFRRLVFTFDPNDNMQPEEYVDWSTQKMTFCSAEMNATVREVHLSHPRPRQDHKPLSDSLYNQLLTAILCHLPNMTNLDALKCTNITFSAQHISNLCLSGSVPQLFLDACRWEIPQPKDLLHRLRVSAFTISTKEDVVHINGWHQFVESDTVSLSVIAPTPQSLSSLKTYSHIVQDLSSLDTYMYPGMLPLLVDILSLQPPLRSLRMHHSPHHSVPLSEITASSFSHLPLLEIYEGPFELLRSISTEQSLAQLRNVQLRAPFNSESAIVHVGSAAPHLERLEIHVHFLMRATLSAVVDHCNMLKDLSIIAENTTLTDFNSVLVCRPLLIYHYHNLRPF